jgi:hypothetical protein
MGLIKSFCLIALLVTLSGTSLLAQETKAEKIEKPFSLGVGIGAAIPLEDFARVKFSELRNDKYGFASPGISLNLNANYQLDKHFAVAALISFNTFNLNNSKVASEIVANDTSSKYRTSATADQSTYYNVNLMVGPRFYFPVGKVTLYLQPMVGWSTLGSDFQVQTRTKSFNNDTILQQQTTKYQDIKIGSGLSHGAAIGLKWPIGDKYSLSADLTYLNLGTREYSSDITTFGFEETTFPDGTKDKVLSPLKTNRSNIALMNVATLNFSVGFNIQF